MCDYTDFTSYVESVCNSNDLSNFKSHPHFVAMLEHVSEPLGKQYLDYIQTITKIETSDIISYCAMNDKLGNPNKNEYGFGLVSPTSLRYMLHAHLILTHLHSLQLPLIDIVEVGGGYGGLCFAVYYLSKKYNININSYTIIDLTSILNLQKKYISTLDCDMNIHFENADMFGKNIKKSNMFLISNYCFSETHDYIQKNYIKHLFPKVSHGFMAWNHIPTYFFGFQFREEKEFPLTGNNYNKFLFF